MGVGPVVVVVVLDVRAVGDGMRVALWAVTRATAARAQMLPARAAPAQTHLQGHAAMVGAGQQITYAHNSSS